MVFFQTFRWCVLILQKKTFMNFFCWRMRDSSHFAQKHVAYISSDMGKFRGLKIIIVLTLLGDVVSNHIVVS